MLHHMPAGTCRGPRANCAKDKSVGMAGRIRILPIGLGLCSPDLAAYEMHEEALSQIRQVLPQERYGAAQARDGENLTVRRERNTGNSATFSQAGKPLPAGRIPRLHKGLL